MPRIALHLILALIAFADLAAQQQIRFNNTPIDTVWARLDRFGGNNLAREQTLKTMFGEAGCNSTQVTVLNVPHSIAPNVLCTIPGESDEVILVGAHFDYVDQGKGVADNWSGAALLPSILEATKSFPRKHTFVFIGFTDEEKGLIGSQNYLKQLGKANSAKIVAMVNVDTVGLAPTELWVSRADPRLLKAFASVARAMQLPVAGLNFDDIGSSDSESFRERHIPSITVHSVTQKNFRQLHTPEDRIELINRQYYFDTYRLIAGTLAYLDLVFSTPSVQTAGKP